MEVFISWSGERSKTVAKALRDWLPSVIQSIRPFMSETDIEKGARWPSDLALHLDEALFGLICLTQENLEAPWLLFEAGALSKSLDDSRVVPYLYGISPTQLEGPLAQFQAAFADKPSTFEVLKSINGALEGNGLDSTRLEGAFETWWPKLEQALENIPETTDQAPPPRPDREILEEILVLSRQMSRQIAPSSEFEQETLRNRWAHGLHMESVDSGEDLQSEDASPPIASDPMRRARLRRYLARDRRTTHEFELLARQQHELLRRLREISDRSQPSSEKDTQSSNDNDEEG